MKIQYSMKAVTVRRKHIFFSYAKDFIKHYGVILLILCSLAILSILTGAFSVSKYDGGLSEKDFFDKILYYLSEGNLTFWRVFFNRIFYFILIIFLSFITSQNKFLIIINASILIVFCYLLGIDIGIVFSIFSLRGKIFCACVYIPIILLSILSLILIDCVFIKRVQELKKYGTICNDKDNYIIFAILLGIVILLQSCIFPVFNNIFIIIT